jgi:hypothetical protein
MKVIIEITLSDEAARRAATDPTYANRVERNFREACAADPDIRALTARVVE